MKNQHANDVIENLDETAAADSIKTKTASISSIVSKMQGLSHDDITKLSEVINQYGTNGQDADKGLPGGANAASNVKTISTKTIKEDLMSIFGKDEMLKEDAGKFMDDLVVLFESALNIRTAEIEERLLDEAADVLSEMVEERVAELTEGLDDYLDEAVNEWIAENELAIESSVKINQFESFMEGLRDLFEAHDIDVPEESLDIVEELSTENEELRALANELIDENTALQKVNESMACSDIVDGLAEGMVLTDAEKLKMLVEDIEYTDLEDFERKAKILKEHHFSKAAGDSLLNEEVVVNETAAPVKRGETASYAKFISTSVKNKK